MDNLSCVGKSIPRLDAQRQVRGALRYGDDLFRPNMLFAAAKYSDLPHARLLSVDCSAAEQMKGVHAVISHRDVPVNQNGSGIYGIFDQPVLAADRVRFRGDAIAVVAAESEELARKAASAIRVEYEPLPFVNSIEAAIAPTAPVIHPELFDNNISHHLKLRYGDCSDAAFSEAYWTEDNVYSTPKVEHAPIETHTALAEVMPDGQLVITTSSSRPFNYLGVLTNILQMPASAIRVRTEAVGGAFGGKNEVTMEPWVALLALKTKAPVKMTWTREEEMTASTVRHAYQMHYKTAVDRDGKLLANRVEIYVNSGAYLGLGNSTMLKSLVHASGPYRIPNVKVDAYLVYTNTLIGSSMRGMGVPQVCFAMESQMDMIAHKLGISPSEIRMRNLFSGEGQLPNGQVISAAGARASMLRAMELFHENASRGTAT